MLNEVCYRLSDDKHIRNKAGSLRSICILVMFDVLFIVIFKLRSYILGFHTMYFY